MIKGKTFAIIDENKEAVFHIKSFLQNEGGVVNAHFSFEDLRRSGFTIVADVAIIGLHTDERITHEAIQRLKAKKPLLKVIVNTSKADQPSIDAKVLRLMGVNGFFLRTGSVKKEIRKVIETVIKGEDCFAMIGNSN